MDELRKHLTKLGLTKDEVKVYLTAIELGKCTILQLARSTYIPRTTVYLIIESLLEKELLKQSAKGKKKIYFPATPEELLSLARKKKQEINETIASLEQETAYLSALYNKDHKKPRVLYYEGIDGIKKIYEGTLASEKILVHCMSQTAREIMGDYLEHYFERVISRMIHTFEIVSDSSQDKQYQKEYSTLRNKIITIPATYTTDTNYMIYGDKVAFITYKDSFPVAIVIDDKELSFFETIRFMMIWEKFSVKH